MRMMWRRNSEVLEQPGVAGCHDPRHRKVAAVRGRRKPAPKVALQLPEHADLPRQIRVREFENARLGSGRKVKTFSTRGAKDGPDTGSIHSAGERSRLQCR